MSKRAGVITIRLNAGTAEFARDMDNAKSKVREFGNEVNRSQRDSARSVGQLSERITSLTGDISDLKRAAAGVKEELAATPNFKITGTESMTRFNAVLGQVKEAGSATEATLAALAAQFEATNRGGRTYTQVLDKIAANKGATQAVRDMARTLSDEAKEANVAAAAHQKRLNVLNRETQQQIREVTRLQREARKEQGGHEVPAMAAASASVRLLEGTPSIRATERFIGTTLGLGPLLEKAFPIVGGIAFLDMLKNMGEEVHSFFQQIELGSEKAKGAFRELTAGLRLTNDELRVSNDRLENEIAKLEGKPQNMLKLAIDEARVAADRLADSLDKDFANLHKLLGENNVSIARQILGEAGTKDITEAVGGKSGFGGFRKKVTAITDEGNDLLDRATDEKSKNEAQTVINAKLRGLYDAEISRVQEDLNRRKSLQAEHNAPPDIGRIVTSNARLVPEQTVGVEEEEAYLTSLRAHRRRIVDTSINTQLTEKKEKLEAAKATPADNVDPFADRLKKLSAELDGIRAKLRAAGDSESGKQLANAYAEALKEITEVNKELQHKKRPPLASDQEDLIFNAQARIQAAKAEDEWQNKLAASTAATKDRIRSQELLTDAIGRGYEAVKRANVETQVMQTVGPEKFNDPDWMRAHQADVGGIRKGLTDQYDSQHAHQVAEAVDKLQDQIALEKSLAAVQERGAEAVNLQTLAYKLRQLAQDGATKQLNLEVELFNAQKQNRSNTNLAKINEEIEATKDLLAVQIQGAEAVRRANLENKYTRMRRDGAQPEEIQATRTADDLQHQQQVTGEAIRTGMVFKDQIESIHQEIAALEKLKAEQGASLEIEISLKNLRTQEVRTIAEQTMVFGTARDGMRAFFQEMATEAQSSARMVHDTLTNAFNSLNDTLSRVMSGQKVSWANFFTSIGQDINKMALQRFESEMAGKIFGIGQPTGGKRYPWDEKMPDGSDPAAAVAKRGGILGKLGGIFGGGALKRDGNSAATALFVQTVGPGAAQPLQKIASENRIEPGSTPANPLYVWVENPAPSGGGSGGEAAMAGGFGAILGGLFGGGGESAPIESITSAISYGGAFAEGGRVGPNKFHLVGEKGPELFIPKTAGTIIPNRKLAEVLAGTAGKPFGGYREMGGSVSPSSAYMVGEGGKELFVGASGRLEDAAISAGGARRALVHHEYNIDARGADAALVERRVVSAIRAAHSDAIMTGQKVSIERSKRTPTR
jgi:hypothetical protein